ncbi:MAG: tryptophanase [Myxococcota bacterium]
MRTIIEPFRIKAVEPIRTTTVAEREDLLRVAGWNLFAIPAEAVTVDLLTDSGTGAMSAAQWAAVVRGDESYAGSPSFFRLREVARERFGFDDVLPVHQGRAAERILFGLLGGPGKVVPGNTHFDTTRANIEATGATALDLPVAEGLVPSREAPWKGNLDIDALRAFLARHGTRVPCVLVTITNNALGGQPVSLGNLRAARRACEEAGVPLFLDAARFAENAYLARERDPALAGLRVSDVARRYFDLCDGFLLSAKKDALCHTGGLLGLRDASLLDRARVSLIVTEGFPTYGGLAGRDLEAMAVGLREAVDEDYLAYRAAVARYFAHGLDELGVPCVRPPGLHAVYVDAGAWLPHVPASELPGQALAVELFRVAGVRACEVGTLLRGDGHGGPELLRLALPRRVYTQSHVDYVIETFAEIAPRRASLGGFRAAAGGGAMRHFTARLEAAAHV